MSRPTVTPSYVAATWMELMTDVLGDQRFGACGGSVGSHVISVYWHSRCIATSMRQYYDDDKTPSLDVVTVPAGASLTPETAKYPREFAERACADMRRWRGPRRGGHFLPIEEPDAIAADPRDLVRPLRDGRD